MSLQRITQQPKTGSGVVSDEQAIAVSLAEQTVARQSAGTVVKSPSSSAHGSEFTPKTKHPSTTTGADEHAPSFSAVLSPRDVLDMRLEIEAAGVNALSEYERLQEERFRLARESMMRTIRMEAERKNEQRACAEKLATDLQDMATDLDCERVRTSVYKFLALMGWIIVPVLWVVTR